MLSPCIRQVIHALLTRPPLIRISLGFNPNPFDLHVLGTPPAFILSQDQTLMFYDCFLLPVSLASFQYFSVFWFTVFGLSFVGLLLSSEILPPSAFPLPACFGIFRAALLFICQGSVLLLSSFTRLSALCCSHWQL